jgi:glycosyltransferase involved in cell wall biosynthesis
MSRPKVACISTVDLTLRYGLLNQLHSIMQDGYEVMGISSPGPNVPTIEAAAIRHIPVSMTRRLTPAADLLSLWRLHRVLRRERPTIVHVHTPKASLLGQLAARMAGVPIIVRTLHGFYFHEHMHPAWRRFYITMEKLGALCSDIILSQSQEDMGTAISEGICPPAKIRHLGNGIDVRCFDSDRYDNRLLAQKRNELGLSADRPVVGFAGRLVIEKGIVEFLQAARLVLDQMPGVQFLIVGPTDHAKVDAIGPESAQEYSVADNTIFTGLRHDMPELYRLMDVFSFPSHREGLPRSPMEASAMKVPTVATDVRGCREAVKDGQNGLLVPLGDVPALAGATLALLSDRPTARRMGATGRQMALERFDEQLVFAKVKTEYGRLLQAKGLPLSPPD